MEMSVGEGDGTVEVCATLTVSGGGSTAIDIDIILATSDGKYFQWHILMAHFTF